LVHHLLGEYVGLREQHEYVTVALWVLHTYVFNRFMVTPRLALRSPVAACGKSTLMDILARLTARPAKFDSITTAVIYRLIDETHPTLLIDEADNLGLVLQPNGKLRAVFNSGHHNGGTVAICERGATSCPHWSARKSNGLGKSSPLNEASPSSRSKTARAYAAGS
jgi:hypothetical protein